ncbi:hypothetical protein ACWFMI_23485 [Nocardiopsis terrae]|uniref:hypothetical protein n=1 Tax=Streptomyces sp. NPDC057554 TaxID=3350538 RepID=UPI0036B6E1F4
MTHLNPGTIASFQQRTEAFTAFLNDQSTKENPLDDLPEELERWQQVRVTLTCSTLECPNHDHSWEQLLYLSAAGAQASCALCGGAPHLLAHFTDGTMEIPNQFQPQPEPDSGQGDQEGFVAAPTEEEADGR